MFTFKQTTLNRHTHQFTLLQNNTPLSYTQLLTLWQQDKPFRAFFISLLSAIPFKAYRWETPPITQKTANRLFECVVYNSPTLVRPPSTSAFASHFVANSTNSDILIFKNLGKDATLIVPTPRHPQSAYAHLASFTRQAPHSQNHTLWQTVGQTMQQQLHQQPIWLSTAGGGVPWLHIRLDSRPKYYGHTPYRTFNQ